jgi:hypothetical protein
VDKAADDTRAEVENMDKSEKIQQAPQADAVSTNGSVHVANPMVLTSAMVAALTHSFVPIEKSIPVAIPTGLTTSMVAALTHSLVPIEKSIPVAIPTGLTTSMVAALMPSLVPVKRSMPVAISTGLTTAEVVSSDAHGLLSVNGSMPVANTPDLTVDDVLALFRPNHVNEIVSAVNPLMPGFDFLTTSELASIVPQADIMDKIHNDNVKTALEYIPYEDKRSGLEATATKYSLDQVLIETFITKGMYPFACLSVADTQCCHRFCDTVGRAVLES